MMIPSIDKSLKTAITELATDLVKLSHGDVRVQAHIIGSVCVGGMHTRQTEKLLTNQKIPEPIQTAKQIHVKGYETWEVIKGGSFSFESAESLKFFISEMNRIDRENKDKENLTK